MNEIEDIVDSQEINMAKEGYSLRAFCLVGKKKDRMENFRSRQGIEKILLVFLKDGKLGSDVN